MNREEIKKKAREFGADLVGIAALDRLEGAPGLLEANPRLRSVVVVGHRIMRGTLRGIEEGTNYSSTYGDYGKNWQEGRFLARTVYLLSCALEDAGIENTPLMIPRDVTAGNVVFDWRVVAEAAGLGSVGKGGFFLTPQYGHRQRFALLLLDADVDSDPLTAVNFCRDCQACATACPLRAVHTEAVAKVGGTEVFARDEKICAKCKNGAYSMGEGLNSGGSAWGWGGRTDVVAADNADYIDRYAAACGRACMVALENKIGEKFENRFRKRPVWSADADGIYTVEEK